MTPGAAVVLAAAGFVAGSVNAVAGGGSLISFPALLAAGYPAVTANVTNTVAIWPGYVRSAVGFRADLVGQRQRVIALGVTARRARCTGAVLLLTTPESLFRAAVPWAPARRGRTAPGPTPGVRLRAATAGGRR